MTAIEPKYRQQFVRGAKFRVIKAGANISGMKPHGPNCQVGYREILEVGRIIVCSGDSMTYGDGVPAIKWENENRQAICNDAIFSHCLGGMWSGHYPEPGWLESVEDKL